MLFRRLDAVHPSNVALAPHPMLPSWASTLSYPMDGVAGVQLASSMLGEYFSIAAWTLTLSTLKGRGARLGDNSTLKGEGGLCDCACACVCVCVCVRVCVCVCVAVASEKYCRGLSVLQSMKCHHEWPRHRSHLLCSAQKWSLPRSQAPCSLINERYGCMRMRGCCELDLCMAFTIALGAGRLQGMEDRRASAKML